jgi:hypothetical protein
MPYLKILQLSLQINKLWRVSESAWKKFGNKIAKTFDDCSENDQPCAEPISDTDNLSLEIEKATDDIFKLNLQEASKYTYRVRVCSGESNLSVDDLGTCCGENSLIRTTTKVVIKVLDENINAPNFDLYVGPNDVQRLNEGTWVQNDDVDKVGFMQILILLCSLRLKSPYKISPNSHFLTTWTLWL